MPLETRRANLSDAAAIASIFTAARGTNALDQACYPEGLSEADQQARVHIFRTDLQDPSRIFYIVEDAETAASSGRTPVSFIEWRIGTVQSMKGTEIQHAAEGSLYRLREYKTVAQLVDDTNAGWEKYMKGRRHIRKLGRNTVIAKPEELYHAGLEELYCLPSYERRGIASSLLNILKKYADEQQLPIFMEAVTRAKALYERHGFVTLQEYIAYIPEKGKEGLQPYSNWHMLREPVQNA